MRDDDASACWSLARTRASPALVVSDGLALVVSVRFELATPGLGAEVLSFPQLDASTNGRRQYPQSPLPDRKAPSPKPRPLPRNKPNSLSVRLDPHHPTPLHPLLPPRPSLLFPLVSLQPQIIQRLNDRLPHRALFDR